MLYIISLISIILSIMNGTNGNMSYCFIYLGFSFMFWLLGLISDFVTNINEYLKIKISKESSLKKQTNKDEEDKDIKIYKSKTK